MFLGLSLSMAPATAKGSDTQPGSGNPPGSSGFDAKVAALEAVHDVPDDQGGWTGFTNEVFDTTVVCTTPAEIVSAVDVWRNGQLDTLLDILCDWDGSLGGAEFFRLLGASSSFLTANPAAFGGYDRPAGGIRIRPQTGRTPALGVSVLMYSMPKIEFNGVGFSRQAYGLNADNIRNIQGQSTATFPLPSAVVIKNCKVGLGHWKPSEPFTEFVRGFVFQTNLYLSVHVENCDFFGCRDQMSVSASRLRVWNNHSHGCFSDFTQCFGFQGDRGWTSTDRCYVWSEGNVLVAGINDPALYALHQDFLQTGTPADAHEGYSVLCRHNIAQMGTPGSQGQFNDDHTNPSSEFVVYENIFTSSAYNAIMIWDRGGVLTSYIQNNTVMVPTFRQTSNDSQAWIRLMNIMDGGELGNFGPVEINDNMLSSISNVGGYTITESGNLYVNPQKDRVSGDGTSAASAKRPEDVFTGTFIRDGNDFLTFSLTGEDDLDRAVPFYAVADHFKPVGGWGSVSAGCSDPESWPGAPVRP